MKKIYYEKVGHRYVPVSEYDSDLTDSLSYGDHLISLYRGGSSRCYNIDPNFAAMIAAGRYARDSMCDAIRDAAQIKPNEDRQLSPAQLEAWENFVAVMGESGRCIHFNSAHDIAQAGIKAMEQEANKLMTHPAVQDAYNQFLTVCKMVSQKA